MFYWVGQKVCLDFSQTLYGKTWQPNIINAKPFYVINARADFTLGAKEDAGCESVGYMYMEVCHL